MLSSKQSSLAPSLPVLRTAKHAHSGKSPRGKKPQAEATERYPRNPQKTRQRILDAALKEFCKLGYHGARIDNIAKRAGANKRLIYAYIGSKEKVYLTVLEQAYRSIREEEQLLDLEHLPPKEGLRALAKFTFQHFLKHPTFVRLLIGENMNEARYIRKLRNIRAMHSPLVEQIRRLLARGEQSGEFRNAIDPVQLYISIAGLGFFYVSNHHTLSTIFGRDLMTSERLHTREEHIVDFVVYSISKS